MEAFRVVPPFWVTELQKEPSASPLDPAEIFTMELHFLRALQTTPTYTHWLLDTQREQKSLVVYEGFKAWMSWRCISCQCYYLKDVSQLVKKKKNRVIRGHWLDVPKASGYIK